MKVKFLKNLINFEMSVENRFFYELFQLSIRFQAIKNQIKFNSKLHKKHSIK